MWPRQEERITETTYTNYGGQPGPSGPPPQVPPPWVARWDGQSSRWFFVNEQTRETRWEFSGNNNFYSGPPNRPYGETSSTTTVVQEERGSGQKHGGSGLGWGLAAGAAGLVGGALLMHEGHEIKEHWREDEYRAEDRVDEGAHWVGEKVQDVEDIPHDVAQGFDRFGNRVEQGFDNTVDFVEDAPDRIAEGAGEMVGGVERFGDGIQDSYEEGRSEARNDDYYDDNNNNDRW